MLNLPIYTPHAWYWLADDGRVFSSAGPAIVTASDSGYVAFLASGRVATIWPRNTSGAQTIAAMQDVMTPYSITVPTS
jgi:hypothetical protein